MQKCKFGWFLALTRDMRYFWWIKHTVETWMYEARARARDSYMYIYNMALYLIFYFKACGHSKNKFEFVQSKDMRFLELRLLMLLTLTAWFKWCNHKLVSSEDSVRNWYTFRRIGSVNWKENSLVRLLTSTKMCQPAKNKKKYRQNEISHQKSYKKLRKFFWKN